MKTAIELAEVAGSFLPDEKGYFLMQEMSATLLQQAEQLSGWLAANRPGGWIDDLRNKCEALETDYDALKADAERYRWLRALPIEAPQIGLDVVMWSKDDESVNSGIGIRLAGLDAAIDAMKGKS
jgi:hypothetical protein